MNLTFSLSQNDYLQFHLWLASKNANRFRHSIIQWLLNSSFGLFCFYFIYQIGDRKHPQALILISVAFVLACPFWLHYERKKRLEKLVNSQYKNRVGIPIEVLFTDEWIEEKSKFSETKFFFSGFENFVETGKYFYLKLKQGEYIIIPKSELEDIESLRSLLKNIAISLHIDFIHDSD